jgi:hypothetical protein
VAREESTGWVYAHNQGLLLTGASHSLVGAARTGSGDATPGTIASAAKPRYGVILVDLRAQI